ncbi:heavy metal translocating P-type ATPase [Sporolactobacillus sp. CQH2019]|uniref:heavy metal translocating P-type ATPase n=1 Tax=Sporolactobacillus sp. CQH2019 TaxID=3023512 RepID=UPI0023678491|nr:heavy metal translocating P-type ATPase [Sporolactobacillus sp. CQH2019]MDD9149596.1 heavy metal translocating P-type ATPase [Sporolactobacillus sp. CQH2019]
MNIQKWLQRHHKHITFSTGILIVLGFLSKDLLRWGTGYEVTFITASILSFLPIAIRAWQALKVKVISIELLVSIAVIGAFFIGEYNESAIVTFLFLFGSYLEQKTLQKTRSSIQALTKMAPVTAWVYQKDGEAEEKEIDEVNAGDELLVKTGAQVPVDGMIVSGRGYLNEASITGESRVVDKTVGATVFAGTILDNGTLRIKATRVGEDTTFGKIIELIEEAQDTKSHAEKFIDRFARFYTPAVLLLALVVWGITQDIRLAITILVLGCPGALVIGAPVSNVAGIGNGAKRGVLIKGGEIMDTFSKVDTLVFDKTGTLTKGRTELVEIHAVSDQRRGLAYAAALERESDHPLGKAILAYAQRHAVDYRHLKVTQTQVDKGKGIRAVVEHRTVRVGNRVLLTEAGIRLNHKQEQKLMEMEEKGVSTVLVAVDQQLVLMLGIADTPRDGAKEALAALKTMGVRKRVMLTGDNARTAQAIAQQLGIDEVHAELLPEDKVLYVEKLKESGHTVAFIGDGVNDSPSIASANIGIAMGSGTDVAVETSDIVLMKSSFAELVHAYGLTKKTVINMKENIMIAIATVIFLIIGLILGYIYMASGMFVHEASILVVIFNGMRLLGYHAENASKNFIAPAVISKN